MTKISSRITLWYVATVITMLVCLFASGHFLLQRHLISQLDALNETQFNQLKFHLGPDYATASPSAINERIRQSTESASRLFYTDLHGPMTNRFFLSSNLHGLTIPDLPGVSAYTTNVEGIGELRVREFHMEPFEAIIATPIAPVIEVMNGYRTIFLALLVAAVVLSIAAGYALSQLMLVPVRVIQTTANRIRSDNLAERIPVGAVHDEIAVLGRFLNQMFDRLETSFSEIRRFAADASHELKTPLSLVRLHAERLLVSNQLNVSQRESVQVQLEELSRVSKIIDELLFLSRADARAISVEAVAQEPALFLHSFAPDAAALAEYHGQSFSVKHVGQGLATFEANRIRQVLLNLLANALDVSPLGSRVTLQSTLANRLWRVSVEDEGAGLSTDQREHIFDRFVRYHQHTASNAGSGLGLAICKSIVQLHGGRIFAEPASAAGGLRVVFEIPVPSA